MERVSERLEPGGVPGQLEDAQDPHDAEDLDDSSSIVHLSGRQSSGLGQRQRDVVRHDREQIDYVQRRSQVLQPVSK